MPSLRMGGIGGANGCTGRIAAVLTTGRQIYALYDRILSHLNIHHTAPLDAGQCGVCALCRRRCRSGNQHSAGVGAPSHSVSYPASDGPHETVPDPPPSPVASVSSKRQRCQVVEAEAQIPGIGRSPVIELPHHTDGIRPDACIGSARPRVTPVEDTSTISPLAIPSRCAAPAFMMTEPWPRYYPLRSSTGC